MENERKYVCEVCKGEFTTCESEQEVIEEKEQIFGKEIPIEECQLVCHDCWEIIKPRWSKWSKNI